MFSWVVVDTTLTIGLADPTKFALDIASGIGASLNQPEGRETEALAVGAVVRRVMSTNPPIDIPVVVNSAWS